MIATLSLIIALIFQMFMGNMYYELKMESHEYDDNVITANDFTAMIKIPKKLWKFVVENHKEDKEMPWKKHHIEKASKKKT